MDHIIEYALLFLYAFYYHYIHVCKTTMSRMLEIKLLLVVLLYYYYTVSNNIILGLQ